MRMGSLVQTANASVFHTYFMGAAAYFCFEMEEETSC